MASTFSSLKKKHIDFINEQKIFFVATAPKEGRINLSPKGMDSIRVVDKNKILWLNFTGSGNETAAHLLEDTRMTLMFCSFTKKPQILRVYGHARSIHDRDEEWDSLFSLFSNTYGYRQIIELNLDLVLTSCGEAVPYFEYKGERPDLRNWYKKKGDNGILKYKKDKNQLSLDGKSTGLFQDDKAG